MAAIFSTFPPSHLDDTNFGVPQWIRSAYDVGSGPLLRHCARRGTTHEGYLPAEALARATDLLRRLIGVPLTTIAGHPNTILAVQPPNVIVATDRSPAGQTVPIDSVHQALRRLIRDGGVEIHPRISSYRTAFIGAVLLTLPDARAEGNPPTVVLDNPTPDPQPVSLTYDGDLSRNVTTQQRGEQAQLRQHLFGTAAEAACALCGETYPVRFLWTAHSKNVQPAPTTKHATLPTSPCPPASSNATSYSKPDTSQ